MSDFKQIDEARKTLNLDEEATLQQINKAYKKLAFKYHPDKHKQNTEEKFKKITHAKDILLDYCASYKYSFKLFTKL